MTDKQLLIPQVTVLHGHTSPDTAHLVTDYPYGRSLRCQIRYWLHTADKGQAKNQTRFMSQTTNPKRDGIVWNQPKASTYAAWMVMYLDPTRQNREGEDFVRYLSTGFWVDAAFADRVRLCGAYAQLTEASRHLLDALTTEASRHLLDALTDHSKRANPVSWGHHEQRKQLVHEHYLRNGDLPQRDGTGGVLGSYISESDFTVICAWVLSQGSASS